MSGHRDPLAALGIDPAQLPGLEAYLDLLARWAARTSLTAARSAEERVSLLVAPVLPALSLVEGPDLIDVGSGNGSPGLVLALLRPQLRACLLEPRQRRWAFLQEAIRTSAPGRPGLQALRARHDEYAGPPAATVTVRALRLAPVELAALVRPGGRLLVFGRLEGDLGPFVPEEALEAAATEPGLHPLRRR